MKMKADRFTVVIVTLVTMCLSGHALGDWTTIMYPGSTNTYALGIQGNNIVGCYFDPSNGWASHGFLYDRTTWSTLDVPELAGLVGTILEGVDGQNIVGYLDVGIGVRYDGTTWTPFANAMQLHDIEGNRMVGLYEDDPFHRHGLFYDGTTWTTLDYPGSTWSELRAIDGTRVAGNYEVGMYEDHSFIYDGTTWTVVDSPWGGGGLMDIEGDNMIGWYTDPVSGRFLSYLYDGKTWTTLDYPGSYGTHATGISGNTIVGYYNNTWDGDNYGFIYEWNESVPAPAGIVLSSIGIGLVGWLRRRRAI